MNTLDRTVHPIVDPWQRLTCASRASAAVQTHLSNRMAFASALIVANSNAPIFATMSGFEPTSVAVCGLDVPGFARRLRFVWVDPAFRGEGLAMALGQYVASSAEHVNTAVQSIKMRRLAQRIGFTHWRKVRGRNNFVCSTTAEGLSMLFVHPEFSSNALRRAMQAFGAAGNERAM